MFERLFARGWVCRMHSIRPRSRILEDYSYRLLDAGYRKIGVSKSLLRWEAFFEWLQREGTGISSIRGPVTEEFIKAVKGNPGKGTKDICARETIRHYRTSLRKLLRFLRQDNIIPAPRVRTMDRWYSSGLQEYARFLSQQTGMADERIATKIREAGQLLDFLDVSSWKGLWGKMDAVTIDRYFMERTSFFSIPKKREVTAAMRSVLRYWHLRELMPEDLSWLVPSVHSYRLAALPRFIPWDDVNRLVLAFDRNSKTGCRNYLIMLLLSTYGWRSVEVAKLTLDDIDWKNNSITIRHTKTGYASTYPLLPSVGDALIDYLKTARPDSNHREVMLGVRAPFAPFPSGSPVGYIVTRAFRLAKISPPFPRAGAHTIRHSYAVRMLDHGMPLKTISDMLGHRRMESTEIYTKVDLRRLRDVSLDVVGGIPCEDISA